VLPRGQRPEKKRPPKTLSPLVKIMQVRSSEFFLSPEKCSQEARGQKKEAAVDPLAAGEVTGVAVWYAKKYTMKINPKGVFLLTAQ
jgi:hypothetical protein